MLLSYMRTRPEIERSFYQDKLYEYAYHAAVNYFYGDEEALWASGEGFRLFYHIQIERTQFPFSKESYDANTDIQTSLKLIGLDPDKFWEAIRYIQALAFIRNVDVTPLESSVRERINDLIDGLSEEGTTVTIARGGKNPVVIEDPTTKRFLRLFLQHEDALFSVLNFSEYTGRTLLVNAEKKDVGLQWQIFDEYNAFMSIFKTFCTDKDLPPRVAGQDGSRDKVLLISRILYFTKVVDDEKYLSSKNPLKSRIDKCKKSPRPKVSGEFAG